MSFANPERPIDVSSTPLCLNLLDLPKLSCVYLETSSEEAFDSVEHAFSLIEDWFYSHYPVVQLGSSYSIPHNSPNGLLPITYIFKAVQLDPYPQGIIYRNYTKFCLVYSGHSTIHGLKEPNEVPLVNEGNDSVVEIDEQFLINSVLSAQSDSDFQDIPPCFPVNPRVVSCDSDSVEPILYASPAILTHKGIFEGDWVQSHSTISYISYELSGVCLS